MPSLALRLKELRFGGLVTLSEAPGSPGGSVLTHRFLLHSLIMGGSHAEKRGTRSPDSSPRGRLSPLPPHPDPTGRMAMG